MERTRQLWAVGISGASRAGDPGIGAAAAQTGANGLKKKGDHARMSILRRSTAALIALLVLAVTGTVQAQTSPPGGGGSTRVSGRPPATLFTPPLGLAALGEVSLSFHCQVANVTAQALTVRIQVITVTGGIADDSGDVSLSAGASTSRSVEAGFGSGLYYCKFVVTGTDKDVRAAATLHEVTTIQDGSMITISGRDIVAVPAH